MDDQSAGTNWLRWHSPQKLGTIRALKTNTTVPVPTVYDFSATLENVLGCPYILMDYIDGVPLYDVWFANCLKGMDDEVTHGHRIKALQGIASAMVQLSPYVSNRAGSPVFDSKYELTHASSIRFLDSHAMADRWLVHHDPSNDPIYVPVSPVSDSRHYYTFPLDLHDDTNGLGCLLRQLVRWLPEGTFVLAHPDFDIQNFIVSEEGELRAIIDWDGVCTVPRSVGNLCLPGWLTRDWDPDMYGYKESMEQGKEPVGVWENSPAELATYRGIYRSLVPNDDRDVTSRSLIAENLCIAARESVCRAGILEKLLNEIREAAGGGFDQHFADLAWDLKRDRVDPSVLTALKDGFEALLRNSDSLYK